MTREDDLASNASSSTPARHSRHSNTSFSFSSSQSSSSMRTSEEDLDEKRGLIVEAETLNGNSDDGDSGAYQKTSFVNPDVVRDVIIGLSDGLTVPFALTAGLSGLDNAKIVVIGGLAELVSGAISMGVGGMLSAQAELDHFRSTRSRTRKRVRCSPAESIEEEVRSIFAPLGLSLATSRQVAKELRQVEEEEWSEYKVNRSELQLPVSSRSNNNNNSDRHDESFTSTRGLTPLLMQMGEGLEEMEASRVWQSALTIGSSYFIGGFIPLLPYLFFSSVRTALFASIAITACVLVVFGVVKQKCTGSNDWKSVTKSGLSTLAVGAMAAGSSWAIVRLVGDTA